MTIEYIAHPIGGDVENNIKKIIEICREINLTEPDVVPFAHYLADGLSLNDDVPEERAKGIANDHAIMDRMKFNACRLYGDRISKGMLDEIVHFEKLGVPIKPMTEGTKSEYFDLIN